MFRNNNNWLRYTVEKEIQDNHSELCVGKFKKNVKEFKKWISKKSSWWLILGIVVLVLLLSQLVSYIPILRLIDFENDTTSNLIELRISNIATITSITLVVVGFLINNLALKSPITFKLLFEKLYLYPTIYIILSSIGAFVMLSTLKDSQNLFNNYNNAVLASTYIMIAVLFVIGYLFKTIINFADDKAIFNLLRKELFEEAKENLKISLLESYSRAKYITTVEEAGAERFAFPEHFGLPTGDGNSQDSREKYLHDINLKRLKKYIVRKCDNGRVKLHYQIVSLGSSIKSNDAFVWEDNANNEHDDTRKLHKCLHLKKSIKNKESTYKNYFMSELKDNVSKSNSLKVESILNSIFELYEMEQKYLN